MRKALLISAALMLVASFAFAQALPEPLTAGYIGVFADQAGASCNLVTPASGMFSFYVVHSVATNVGGSEWAAPKPACMPMSMYLNDSNQFAVVIGNTQSGYSVGYGQCKVSPVYICSINFFAMGAGNPACCAYPVIAHPMNANHRIEASDCDLNLILPAGHTAMVNPDGTCMCEVVPVQDTTWGGVKALFE